jgi:uncharacterized protein
MENDRTINRMTQNEDVSPQERLNLNFLTAVRFRSVESMTSWLKLGADINALDNNGKNALFYLTSRPDLVEYLVARGINPKLVDDQKNNPLFFVTDAGLAEYYIKNELLDINQINIFGENAMHDCKNAKVAEVLIQHKIEVNKLNLLKNAPLHTIIDRRLVDRPSIVQQLIKAKANINCQGELLQTPLHCAVSNYQSETIELLINEGADLTITDKNNETAFDLAKRLGNKKIIGIFKRV